MPQYENYQSLAESPDAVARKRTAEGLRRLRAGLAAAVPARTTTDTLLLATWNIREFDSGKYGFRPDEAYYYIAEIVGRFDLVAVQEVRDGLYPLQRLCKLLGAWWDFIVTDVTLGTAGNAERMAYLFDRRKVRFTGLAAELVLPSARGARTEPVQMARSPYIAGFSAGWAYLTLATVHIYYGSDKADDPRRLAEITAFATTLARHAATFSCVPQDGPGRKPAGGNLLMLGDFNIFARGDVTMAALGKAGFHVPEQLQSLPGSNVAHDRFYDQIAYLDRLEHLRPTGKAGVFDFYEHVYRLGDEPAYAAERATRPGSGFADWRTYRMSDHLPMWIEFGIDDGDAALAALA